MNRADASGRLGGDPPAHAGQWDQGFKQKLILFQPFDANKRFQSAIVTIVRRPLIKLS